MGRIVDARVASDLIARLFRQKPTGANCSCAAIWCRSVRPGASAPRSSPATSSPACSEGTLRHAALREYRATRARPRSRRAAGTAVAPAFPRSMSASSTVFAAHHSVHGPALTRSLHAQAAVDALMDGERTADRSTASWFELTRPSMRRKLPPIPAAGAGLRARQVIATALA